MSKSQSIEGVCRFRVNRAEYLRQFETVFLRPILRGYDAVPVGNGDLAAILWQPDHLTWMLNKCDISGEATQAARLIFETPGKLTERAGLLETRLSLAAATATVRYTGGKIGFPSAWRGRYRPAPKPTDEDLGLLAVTGYVPDGRNVLLVDYHESPKAPHPTTIVLERWVQSVFGDDVRAEVRGNTLAITYQMKNGTSYAAVLAFDGFAGAALAKAGPIRAELRIPPAAEVRGRLAIAVVTSHEAADPLAAATRLAEQTLSEDPEAVRKSHLRAWDAFWGRSFVDSGHPYANALYHMALYELGVTSRGRRPVKFNGALNLWSENERTWGEGYTCHNQHSTYLPVYAANHVELAENFHDWIARVNPEAVKAGRKYFGIEGAYYPEYMSHEFKTPEPDVVTLNDMSFHLRYLVSSGVRYASLLWSRYQYTLDETFLAEKAYAVIRDVAAFYANYGKLGEDGLYHVAPSLSWEEQPQGRDGHADCAAWRFIFATAIEAATILGVDKVLLPVWRERLRKAPPYPVKDGIFSVVIRDDGTPEPPEHFQWQLPNLSGVFPYNAIGLDSPAALRQMAERTFERFRFNTDAGHEYLPVIAARLGRADWWRAAMFQYIQFFQCFDQGLLHYYNANGNKDEDWPENAAVVHPYLEASGIFATGINEMLFQSYNGVIRVFPAVPAHWDARFVLRAAGAFMVASEHRREQGVPYIAVQAIGGKARPCRVAPPWKDETDIARASEKQSEITTRKASRTVEFEAQPGVVYVLTPKGTKLEDLPMVELGFKDAYSPSRLGTVWYGNREGANNHTVFPLW